MIADRPLSISLTTKPSTITNDEPNTTFFLFLNSGSGGGLGAKIVEQEVCKNVIHRFGRYPSKYL